MLPRALTIAGSDSGGGAGIQADLKTFTMLGVYGATAITALTAQNTLGVSGVVAVDPEFVRLQIDTVLNDIGCDAAKTGMLANEGIIRAVADAVRSHHLTRLVVDPVMVAQSGASLLDPDACAALLRELIPLAMLVTPNTPEASTLLGAAVNSVATMRDAAQALVDRGARAALVKGGHLDSGDAVDVLYDGTQFIELTSPRIATRNTHGTGCTLSAAITAGLASGLVLDAAVRQGKEFVTQTIAGSLALGRGAGPANPLAWRKPR